jgi:hypothetical protein
VGLGNIEQRLQYLFEGRASLEIRNNEDGGARVTMTLPAQATVAPPRPASPVKKENRRLENNAFIPKQRYV